MIMFVGQVDRGFRDREAWQEIDCRAVFGSMTKWTAEIETASRVTEYVSRAFHTAMNGRPGPVVLALPHDMLAEATIARDAPAAVAAEPAPCARELAALQALLDEAGAPVLLVGGGRWDEDACAAVRDFAERFELPVATAYRRLPLFDPVHANYAGDLGLGANPKLVARVKAADLVLAVGARLDEVTTQGYGLFESPGPKTKLVHVYPGAEELGRVFAPQLSIHASPAGFASALDGLRAPPAPAWRGSAEAAHAEYLAWSEAPTPQPGGGQPGRDHDLAARCAARRCDHLQRRRQLSPPGCTVSSASAGCGEPHRADFRLDGLRHAGRRRYAAAVPRPPRRLDQRRRRLPDERPGVRHRRAVRPADRRRGARQRLLRHHPHAPGAGVPRPGDRRPT